MRPLSKPSASALLEELSALHPETEGVGQGRGWGGRSLGEMAKAKAPRAAAAAHGRPAEMIRPLSSIAHANKA